MVLHIVGCPLLGRHQAPCFSAARLLTMPTRAVAGPLHIPTSLKSLAVARHSMREFAHVLVYTEYYVKKQNTCTSASGLVNPVICSYWSMSNLE
jgi:hypothetical protein